MGVAQLPGANAVESSHIKNRPSSLLLIISANPTGESLQNLLGEHADTTETGAPPSAAKITKPRPAAVVIPPGSPVTHPAEIRELLQVPGWDGSTTGVKSASGRRLLVK